MIKKSSILSRIFKNCKSRYLKIFEKNVSNLKYIKKMRRRNSLIVYHFRCKFPTISFKVIIFNPKLQNNKLILTHVILNLENIYIYTFIDSLSLYFSVILHY